MDATEIIKRFGQVEAQRRVVQQQWDDISILVAPYRGDFFNLSQTETSTDWRENRNVFDSTAINAAQTLSASIHGALTPRNSQWFGLVFRDADLNTDKEASAWLTECADIVFMTLQESNFDLEAGEIYLDLVSFGSAMISMEAEYKEIEGTKVFSGVDFQAVPIKEGYFEPDVRGNVVNFYRKYNMTPLQIVSKFGEDTPQHIKEKAKSSDIDQRIDIIFCIYERKDKKEDDGTIKPKRERRFGYKWVVQSDATQIGEEGGYYSSPVSAPLWRKTSGSQWGNSPAMVALADIKTLNSLVELGLAAVEKAVDPTILAEERSLFGSLDMTSGAINVVKNIDGVRPFESASRFDVEFSKEDRYRESIRQTFLNDQLQIKDSPASTATEVSVRYRLMQRILGPTSGRLQSGWLSPTIHRLFSLLHREGQLPEMPDIVKEKQAHMMVEYIGELASSQKADKIAAIDEFVVGTIQMAEAVPEVLDKIDFDLVTEERAKALGVPMDMLASKEKVNADRKQRQEQMQQAQEIEMANMEGQAMKSMGEGEQAIAQQ